ncbi:mycothiol system anti-sigma-R factor [Actinomycetospora lutea]|uniref:mycothiol system anti-sigma-R factor n=1 Tax=Actinomycetospora lutea TaxID=663604 RepID=UPI002366AF3F|nr:mycothiol system anti-sigma-R factor [Actinomycetospora lutea]MDD7940055.1 mycothiol system anti-sigma-R factor [Actinomycetospora lutea]
MSCGDHHETDCSEVLAEVWLLLDHECDEARDAQLRRHLDECGPCLARYGLEEKVKTLLSRSCRGEHAPAGLHQRLREQIRATMLEQAEVTVERGPAGTVVEVNQTRVESWKS